MRQIRVRPPLCGYLRARPGGQTIETVSRQAVAPTGAKPQGRDGRTGILASREE